MEQEELESAVEKPNLKLALIGLTLGLTGVTTVLLLLKPNAGPIAILLFLALTFLIFLSIAALMIQIAGYRLLKKNYTWPRVLYTAVLISAGGIFLVGLQTLGQLQTIDVILVGVFEVLLNFYIFRRF